MSFGYDDVLILRVAGLGDADGQWTLSTALTAPTGWSASSGVSSSAADWMGGIATLPDVAEQRFEPMGTIATDAGLTLEIERGGVGATFAQALIRQDAQPGLDNGSAIRVDGYLSAAATTVNVTPGTAGISTNAHVWIGDEAMLVTAKGATTLTVTRGQLGTTAREIPGTAIGRKVWTLFPGATNRLAQVIRIDRNTGATEATVFTGILRKPPTLNNEKTRVKAEIDSITTALRKVEWAAPPARVTTFSGDWWNPTEGVTLSDVVIGRETAKFGAVAWGHARLYRNDEWAIFALDSTVGSATYYDGTALSTQAILAGSRPIATGRGSVASSGDEWRSIVSRLATTAIPRAEHARVWTNTHLAEIVDDLLTETAPTGTALGIPAALVASLANKATIRAIDLRQYASNVVAPGPIAAHHFVILPFKGKILDLIADHVLGGWGCGIGTNQSGAIRVVDWTEDLATAEAIDSSDCAGAAYDWEPRSEGIAGVIIHEQAIAGMEEPALYVQTSDLALDPFAGPATRTYDVTMAVQPGPEAYEASGLKWRAEAMMNAYQRPVPTLTIPVHPGVTSDVGGTVTVDWSVIPDPDGTLGPDAPIRGKVIGVRQRIASRIRDLVVILTGWNGEARSGATWAATATCQSYNAGTKVVTCYANRWTDSAMTPSTDAASFTTGQAVILLDRYGTVIDNTTLPTVTVGVNSLTLSAAFTSDPVDTNILIPAKWDQVSSGVRGTMGFFAGSDGTLGAGADPAKLYS